MYPYINIGEMQFPSYALCVFFGAIVSIVILTCFWRARRVLHVYMPSLAHGFIGLILSAKLFGILSKGVYNFTETGKWDLYDAVTNSGIVYWGGLLGFIFAIFLSCKLRKKSFGEIANSLAVVIPLFHGFGRIGCFFAGCCYGKETESFMSVPYRIGFEGTWVGRYPTQLCEAGFEFVVFSALFWWYCYKRREKGFELLYVYVAVYSIFRFFIEFYRADKVRGALGAISFSQIISVITLIFAVFMFIKKERTI